MTQLSHAPAIRRRALLAAALIPAIARAEPGTAANDAAPKERRLLVVGDSQAQGLAGGLIRLYLRRPAIRVLDRSKIATGLSHGPFDWPAEAKRLAETEHAEVALVMFGANDRPAIRLHGTVDQKRAEAFRTAYAAHVAAVATSLKAAAAKVLWIGHPQVRDPDYNEDMRFLNEIFERAATKAGAEYVPIWDLFAGEDGKYDAYGKGLEGATERLRADDGVHLSRSGYDVLAHFLAVKLPAQ